MVHSPSVQPPTDERLGYFQFGVVTDQVATNFTALVRWGFISLSCRSPGVSHSVRHVAQGAALLVAISSATAVEEEEAEATAAFFGAGPRLLCIASTHTLAVI